MRYLYILLILKIFLNDTWGRMKLTKVRNLTVELHNFNGDLLTRDNYTNEFVPYRAVSISSKTNRIVGGHPIHINKEPSVAYLLELSPETHNWRFGGGAVIVGKDWALTAAHCFDSVDKSDTICVCGNTSKRKRGFIKHEIVKRYIHERYDKYANTTDYDIALVKVKEPFDGKYEKPIKLASRSYKYQQNSRAMVYGWGYTHPNTESLISDHLRSVTVRLQNQTICEKKYKQLALIITSRMICAADKGKDACTYDSGGPLIQNNVLIGIVSWGPGICGNVDYPGVYTKVSFFYDWLQKQMAIKT